MDVIDAKQRQTLSTGSDVQHIADGAPQDGSLKTGIFDFEKPELSIFTSRRVNLPWREPHHPSGMVHFGLPNIDNPIRIPSDGVET